MAGNIRHSLESKHQTPGAGPSRDRSRPHDFLISPAQPCSSGDTTTVHMRTPTRSTTIHEEIELGTYLRPDSGTAGSGPASPSSGKLFATSYSSRRGSAGSISVAPKVFDPGKSLFLANPTWRTDILTFCSHARVDPILGDARITHIQARKSDRPPFLHEYLFVFFTVMGDQRFAMRIDRLGKVGSVLSNRSAGRKGLAANTAVQEIELYHIQDSRIDIDSIDGPWLARDGYWGSRPIATLETWESLSRSGKHVSHHIQTATLDSAGCPRLRDFSRLLEAVLREMPAYHLTTANCYFMTRSSLLLMQRCYSSAFACFLGTTSDTLIHPSALAQPIWAGLLRWYLPFVVLFFLSYISLLMMSYHLIWYTVGCIDDRYIFRSNACHLSRATMAIVYAMHSLLDAPLPVGMMHAYMTTLEVAMNKLVVDLSSQFLETHDTKPVSVPSAIHPFGIMFEDARTTVFAWCALGVACGVLVFIAAAFEHGPIVMFIILLFACVWFNFSVGTGGSSPFPDEGYMDEVFGPIPDV